MDASYVSLKSTIVAPNNPFGRPCNSYDAFRQGFNVFYVYSPLQRWRTNWRAVWLTSDAWPGFAFTHSNVYKVQLIRDPSYCPGLMLCLRSHDCLLWLFVCKSDCLRSKIAWANDPTFMGEPLCTFTCDDDCLLWLFDCHLQGCNSWTLIAYSTANSERQQEAHIQGSELAGAQQRITLIWVDALRVQCTVQDLVRPRNMVFDICGTGQGAGIGNIMLCWLAPNLASIAFRAHCVHRGRNRGRHSRVP